jgi:hypothetical protein
LQSGIVWYHIAIEGKHYRVDFMAFGIEFQNSDGAWQREVINGVPMRVATRREARQHASTYIEFPWRIVEDSGEPNCSHEADYPVNNYGHLEVMPNAKSAQGGLLG